jgi:hypothetical protein
LYHGTECEKIKILIKRAVNPYKSHVFICKPPVKNKTSSAVNKVTKNAGLKHETESVVCFLVKIIAIKSGKCRL